MIASRIDPAAGVLIKWVTCRVLDRAAFDRGQRAWSALRGEPGFLGQGGGWSRHDPDLVHLFGCWADRPGYERWMTERHDRLAAAQAGTYRPVRARLFDHRLPIGLGVPLDFAGASVARIAHCRVRAGRRAHFVDAQASVWNPGMGAAAGIRHGTFAERDGTEFLVVSLWRSAAEHDRYRTGRFPELHRRSAAADDLETVDGDLVMVEPAWTVGGSAAE